MRNSPLQRRLWVIGFALLWACRTSLPLGPSEVTSGIVVYEHPNYMGRSALIERDVKNFSDVKGPCHESSYNNVAGVYEEIDVWNDCISSIRLAPGWRARVFRDSGFDDDYLRVDLDIPDFRHITGPCDGTFNDCISSIVLLPPNPALSTVAR